MRSRRATGLLWILGAVVLTAAGCGKVQRYEGGYAIIPEPQGDATEVSVERLFRAETGLWMGMARGIAIDILNERHQANPGRQPGSGGVMTFRVPDGGYVYLIYYNGPPGSGKILVCGLHLRGVGEAPPPLIAPAKVRGAIGGQNYRRTPDRVISVAESEVLFLDRQHCAHRDPGPPRDEPTP
jgi:hypothetical protein